MTPPAKSKVLISSLSVGIALVLAGAPAEVRAQGVAMAGGEDALESHSDMDSGESAAAAANARTEFSSWVAGAGASRDFGTGFVFLRASANVTASDEAPEDVNARAGASAFWDNDISVQSVQGGFVAPDGLRLTVSPLITGSVGGVNGTASFEMQIGSAAAGYAGFSAAWDSRSGYADNGGLPLRINLPPSLLPPNDPILDLTMSLSVSVGAGPGESSFAEFGNTVILPAILITDIHGNDFPGRENIRLVGSNGFEYATTGIPEPAAAMLLVSAGVLFGTRRSRRQV